MKIRTYLDSNVLIAVGSQKGPLVAESALIFNDPRREFVSSIYVELEVYPSARRNQRADEIAFYDQYFQAVSRTPKDYGQVARRTIEILTDHPIAIMDALHLACALLTGAAEIVTLEKPNKGLCTTRLLPVVSLYPAEPRCALRLPDRG